MIKADTFIAKKESIDRQWHLMDAKDQVLGRLSTRAAHILRGKHKPTFTPYVDCGDGVIIVNAEKIKVTGNKLQTKIYTRYSGYPSGLKSEPLGKLLVRRPTEAVHRAIVGMLPKGPLGRQIGRRLRVYAGPNHPHVGQMKKNEIASAKKASQ